MLQLEAKSDVGMFRSVGEIGGGPARSPSRALWMGTL